MLRIPDPAYAVQPGLRITQELVRGHCAPAVRVGLHHGPAIERDGDCFGATVYLAARVAAAAIGGEVFLTAHTAALAPALEGIAYQPRGQTLCNIREPVDLFAAVSQGPCPSHQHLTPTPDSNLNEHFHAPNAIVSEAGWWTSPWRRKLVPLVV
jgi:adenylate cyclase